MTLDNTYLKVAVERIGEGLEIATKIPVLVEPLEGELANATSTLWVVYVAGMANVDDSSDSAEQTWIVNAQLVWKKTQTQPDKTIYTAAYQVCPEAFNYLQAHKRLIFTSTESAIPYLRPQEVKITLADINQSGQPGFTITLRLPFHIAIEQEY